MITKTEVESVIRDVENKNGVLGFRDTSMALVTRDELRVLIEAAREARYDVIDGKSNAGRIIHD